jgi:hypothetical protein
MRLFDVLNRTYIERVHNKWATAEEYDAIVSYWAENDDETISSGILNVTWSIGCVFEYHAFRKPNGCVNWGFPERPVVEAITEDVKDRWADPLKYAVSEHRKDPSRMIVLDLYDVWRGQFGTIGRNGQQFTFENQIMVNQTESIALYKQQFIFTDWIFELADKALELMNIPPDGQFSLIHWRAEKKNQTGIRSYQQCAKDIVVARDRILQNISSSPKEMPFVLMTALNKNFKGLYGEDRVEWRKDPEDIPKALDYLIDENDFRWTKGLLQQKDIIVYSALDLILAERASVFSTCDRSCKSELCSKCNYLGSFSLLAADARTGANDQRGFEQKVRHSVDDTRKTLRCWPT